MPVPASPLCREDVIQREMQHLREMVFALSIEVAAEKAARGQLQMTVDALEGRDDPGEGAEIRRQDGDSPYAPLLGPADGDETSARAPVAAAPCSPPLRRVRYIGSPGDHDQLPDDYESLQAPQAAEVHQPNAGVTRTDDYDKWWQDPWMQAASRYPVRMSSSGKCNISAKWSSRCPSRSQPKKPLAASCR